jgi:hypothetical protein
LQNTHKNNVNKIKLVVTLKKKSKFDDSKDNSFTKHVGVEAQKHTIKSIK